MVHIIRGWRVHVLARGQSPRTDANACGHFPQLRPVCLVLTSGRNVAMLEPSLMRNPACPYFTRGTSLSARMPRAGAAGKDCCAGEGHAAVAAHRGTRFLPASQRHEAVSRLNLWGGSAACFSLVYAIARVLALFPSGVNCLRGPCQQMQKFGRSGSCVGFCCASTLLVVLV